MELFELKYFLGVAQEENIHRASERLHVSPASLSKAIARLEAELGTKLFARRGRNIELTEAGYLLQARAAELVSIEAEARREIGGYRALLQACIAGPEVLLAGLGLELVEKIRRRFGESIVELHAVDEKTALKEVKSGAASLALVTSAPPASLRSRKLAEVLFQTCVGKGHPLYARAVARKAVPIAEVLQHGFVSSHRALLGKVNPGQSADGWRDDVFPRRVEYVVSCLALLEALVTSGNAIAYLPDYYASKLAVAPLKIPDCPYVCRQSVKLVTLGKSTGWINQIF